MTVSAGIALLTYNGEKYLAQVLDMVQRQKLQPQEIVAIDSGSTDRTVEILQKHRVKLHQIANSEFSHSRTRNCAARMVQSDYIVFITQDATPADSCWLDQLLQPFAEDPDVAGVYSRQAPRPGSDLLEARDLHAYFKAARRVQKMPIDRSEYRKRMWEYIQFSNSSAAYHRNLLLENPFDETLPMAEDQEWAKRMIERGHSIVYQPDSVVLHSHELTPAQKRERQHAFGKAFSKFLSAELGARPFPLWIWMYNVAVDTAYIARASAPLGAKIKWLCRSPADRAAQHYAYYQGWNSVYTRT